MLAQTDHPAVWIIGIAWDAHIRVAIALAATSDYEVSDSIIVGLQDFWIAEHFISKGVKTHQRNPWW